MKRGLSPDRHTLLPGYGTTKGEEGGGGGGGGGGGEKEEEEEEKCCCYCYYNRVRLIIDCRERKESFLCSMEKYSHEFFGGGERRGSTAVQVVGMDGFTFFGWLEGGGGGEKTLHASSSFFFGGGGSVVEKKIWEWAMLLFSTLHAGGKFSSSLSSSFSFSPPNEGRVAFIIALDALPSPLPSSGY